VDVWDFMAFIFSFIKQLFSRPAKQSSTGPNTLEELLKQFDLPPKIKSNDKIIQEFLVKITMYNLEWEMLKMDSTVFYLGSTRTNSGDIVHIDFVPCSVRPDVMYCNIGKN